MKYMLQTEIKWKAVYLDFVTDSHRQICHKNIVS